MLPRANLVVAGILLALLAACTQEIRDVGRLSASGSAFSRALYDGYLQLSKDEYAEKDLRDSNVFAERARAAAAGGEFDPEAIEGRNLPGDAVGELTTARARLMAALEAGGRVKAADDAAHAQVMFDCWMQEAEEDIGPDHIEPCRSNFYDAIAKVEAALAPVAEEPPMEQPEPLILFFGFDSSEIDADGQAVIDNAVATADRLGLSEFSVTGHADRAGSEDYNIGLSLRRADAVKAALQSRGIDGAGISVGGRGEAETAVPTADGVRERANRRVEIIIQ